MKDCLIKKVCLITYTLPNQIRDDVYKKISAYSNFISFVKDECCNISERLRKNYKATMVDLYDSHLLTHNISSFSHYSRRALAEVVMRDYYYCVFDNSKYQEKIAELHSNVFDDYEKAIEWERNNNNILLKIVGDEHGFYSELQKVEEDYKGDLYLPDYLHLHRILPMAIEFCNELTSIDMPDSIREIGGGNFCGCKNIVHVNLPEKLSEISNRCFVNCTSLKSVLIRGRVRTIGDWCFSSCNNLQNVDVTPNNDYMFKDGVYIYSKDRTKLILIADKQIRQAVISHEIVSIGNSAFHSCEQLEEVIIESPIRFKEIGSEAFKHCLNLKRIEPAVLFPSKVGKSALWGCEKIEQFYFNDKTIHIESGVLSGCRSITNVSIPICAEIIGDMAFSNTGISEIFIPKNVITIYNNAFAQCEKLMNIQVDPENQSYTSVDGILYDCDADSLHTFPSGRTGKFVVTNYAPIIGDYAFMGCNLEKVIIEDGVTRIDSFAFVNSKKLKEVRIPNSVKKIGRDLFYECDNLLAVVIDCAYPPEIDTFGFELPPKVVLYVPEGSVEMYRKHPVWGKYPIIDSIGIGDGKTSLQLEYNIHENSLSYVEPNEYGWETIYKECLPKAAIHAVSIIDDYFHSNGINSHKFKWIQCKFREPYFQHLCFSYENKIYSVLIELLDSEYGNLIFKSDILKQLQVCTNNNLIPCIIPLWNDNFSSPLEQIPLIDSQKRQIVYFNKGEDVMIGRWEMEYMAVNYVSERIKEYGGEIIKKSDIPDICPQIWFKDKDGKISYIYLKVFPKNERVNGFKLDVKLLQTLVKYNGYYAEVTFTSMFGRSQTLMRSDDRYQIHISGFTDIEKQAAKFGTIDNKDFKVNKL